MKEHPEGRRRRQFLFAGIATCSVMALVASGLPAQAAATSGPSITVRGSARAHTADSGSIVVDRPSGVIAGDVLVARVANRNNVQAQITGDGWTEVGSTQSAYQLQSVVLTRGDGIRAGDNGRSNGKPNPPSTLAIYWGSRAGSRRARTRERCPVTGSASVTPMARTMPRR